MIALGVVHRKRGRPTRHRRFTNMAGAGQVSKQFSKQGTGRGGHFAAVALGRGGRLSPRARCPPAPLHRRLASGGGLASAPSLVSLSFNPLGSALRSSDCGQGGAALATGPLSTLLSLSSPPLGSALRRADRGQRGAALTAGPLSTLSSLTSTSPPSRTPQRRALPRC
jgi:hypothetical protein